MKILVCLKQVLAAEAAGRELAPRESDYRLNRFDEHALEEALKLKESRPETRVEVLTVGPERAAGVLRRGLGMGADHGIHLLTAGPPPADPHQLAVLIASQVDGRGHDLIFTGVMAEDTQRGQVGVMLAAILGRPWSTAVVAIDGRPAAGEIIVTRELEGGARERLALELPALLTIQAGGNRPRYPTLSGMLRAREQELETIAAASVILPPPRQESGWTAPPVRRRQGLVLTGSPAVKAARLLAILRQRGLVS